MKKANEILTSHNKFHITLGLDRIKKILELLGDPQEKYNIIHVAGTNGKGSTSKLINQFLIEKFKDENINIGLYTSPHLFEYEERIQVNNEKIGSYLFDKLINEVDNLAIQNNIELSEFELLTAVMFYYFYIKNVKYAVIEVGLGGLFDATNVVKKSVSVITTIDLDHIERLGKTIEEIAVQKAGIIKPKTSLVVSKENLGFDIIQNIANEKNAKLIDLPSIDIVNENEKNYAIIDNKKYEFNLLGEHQKYNLQLALGAIKALRIKLKQEQIKNVLKEIKWKFRLDYNKEKNILIDSCHNPSGVKTLKEFLDKNFKDEKKIFIFGCLKNKDYKQMLDILDTKQNELKFYEFDYPNALKFEELDEKYKAEKISSIKEIEEIIEKDKSLKIFCGSIYMLGKIFKEIKL